MPGVDQIQFVVPNDPTIPNDCYVAVAAQVAGVTTNEIWISKTSDGSVCQNKLGFTDADLLQLDQGGGVGLAQLALMAVIGASHSPPGPFDMGGASGFTRTESADFTPSGVTGAQAALVSGPVVADDVFFGCTSSPPLALTAGLAGVLNGPSDYGSEFTLQGAGGTLDLFPLITGGLLFTGAQTSPAVSGPSQLPPPLFAHGAEVFFGSGEPFPLSTAVPVPAAFSVPLTLPAEIMGTNFDALQTINRQEDLVVTWDPTGFGDEDVLTVTLNNAAKPVATPFGLETGVPLATCRTPAASGQIAIPAGMLVSLPTTKPGGPPVWRSRQDPALRRLSLFRTRWGVTRCTPCCGLLRRKAGRWWWSEARDRPYGLLDRRECLSYGFGWIVEVPGAVDSPVRFLFANLCRCCS